MIFTLSWSNILFAESLRIPCVNQGFVPLLLPILESEDVSIATQACRTLGNICFENGEQNYTEEGSILITFKRDVWHRAKIIDYNIINEWSPYLGKIQWVCQIITIIVNIVWWNQKRRLK